jgi:hypothetical protein
MSVDQTFLSGDSEVKPGRATLSLAASAADIDAGTWQSHPGGTCICREEPDIRPAPAATCRESERNPEHTSSLAVPA